MSPEIISQPEKHHLSDDDRLLTEVDHLVDDLINFGHFRPETITDVEQNLETATQEQSMPYAVTTTRHKEVFDQERSQRTFMWLGKTAVQTAMSGYEYHRDSSAHKRVDVEVDEARHASTLEHGRLRIFISPRMSNKDTTLEVAKNEHLAYDDSVRVSWLEMNNGQTERVMQSLLVRNIPLSAWISMLEDQNNIFGKSITIEDRESAVSVMKVHKELELPAGSLENGPVTLINAVIPYIDDVEVRKSVMNQARRYTQNQEELRLQAKNTAKEWIEFEKSLAESVVNGFATYDVRRFIAMMQEQFSHEDISTISKHVIADTEYRMTRELAAILESAQQSILNGRAAVITDNEEATKHIVNKDDLVRVRDTEKLIQMGRLNGFDVNALIAQQNRDIARLHIKPTGGCSGENRTTFRQEDVEVLNEVVEKSDENDRESWVWKVGVCQVEACTTRPGTTEVGPCSVCKKCQAVFDSGGDPTKNKQRSASRPAKLALELTMKAKNEQFARAA